MSMFFVNILGIYKFILYVLIVDVLFEVFGFEVLWNFFVVFIVDLLVMFLVNFLYGGIDFVFLFFIWS